MGRGVAELCISKGFHTTLIDIDFDVLHSAEREINDGLNKAVKDGRLSIQAKTKALKIFKITTDLENSIASVDIVIEAITNDEYLKKSLIARIQNLKTKIIICSTASISIDDLAEYSGKPEYIIGTHFFTPVPEKPLVEVVIGSKTSFEITEQIFTFITKLGKEPIRVKNSPGFAASRIEIGIILEAIRMLEQEIATPEDIDKSVTLGLGHPVAPLRKADDMGLDILKHIAEYLDKASISCAFSIPKLLKEKVERKELGVKSGIGFYNYNEEE